MKLPPILPVLALGIILSQSLTTWASNNDFSIDMSPSQENFFKKNIQSMDPKDLMHLGDALAGLISRQNALQINPLAEQIFKRNEGEEKEYNMDSRSSWLRSMLGAVLTNSADVSLFLGASSGFVSLFFDIYGLSTEAKVGQAVSVALMGLGGYLKKIHDRRLMDSQAKTERRMNKKI